MLLVEALASHKPINGSINATLPAICYRHDGSRSDLHSRCSPCAFSSNKVVVPGDSPSDSSAPCFLSALVHAECSFLNRLPTTPSLSVCLYWASSAITISDIHSALVPGAQSYKRAQSPLFSVYSPLSRFPAIPPPFICPNPINMPRERFRIGSRHGGSRGRATHQHSSTTSDPSSDASEFCCFNYLATRSGRGRGRGQARAEVCVHHSHPTARFRIPCSLGNSSFIVSVTIEKCENAMGSGEVQHGAPVDQRLASQNVTQHQVAGGLRTMNTEANVGPSALARGEPSSSAVHHSDSKDSDQFGCRIIEEQPSTSDED